MIFTKYEVNNLSMNQWQKEFIIHFREQILDSINSVLGYSIYLAYLLEIQRLVSII